MSDPRIVLYGIRITPFTQKVIRALRMKGLDYEYREPSSPAELRRWSPETGLLPVMELDGERVGDSEAILDALERRFPEPPLLSRDPKVAREQRRLSQWVGETFRFYLLRWLSMDGAEATREKQDADGNTLGPLARMGLIDDDGALVPEAFDVAGRHADAEFERRIEDLAGMLGDRPFFYSDEPSRADLAVFSSLIGLYSDRFSGGRGVLDRYPTLIHFVERVAEQTGGLEP